MVLFFIKPQQLNTRKYCTRNWFFNANIKYSLLSKIRSFNSIELIFKQINMNQKNWCCIQPKKIKASFVSFFVYFWKVNPSILMNNACKHTPKLILIDNKGMYVTHNGYSNTDISMMWHEYFLKLCCISISTRLKYAF